MFFLIQCFSYNLCLEYLHWPNHLTPRNSSNSNTHIHWHLSQGARFDFLYGPEDWGLLPYWAHVVPILIAQFHTLLCIIFLCNGLPYVLGFCQETWSGNVGCGDVFWGWWMLILTGADEPDVHWTSSKWIRPGYDLLHPVLLTMSGIKPITNVLTLVISLSLSLSFFLYIYIHTPYFPSTEKQWFSDGMFHTFQVDFSHLSHLTTAATAGCWGQLRRCGACFAVVASDEWSLQHLACWKTPEWPPTSSTKFEGPIVPSEN